MTNKPNDVRVVPVELLERLCMRPRKDSSAVNHQDIIDRGQAQAELRAILAQPADQQDEPVAWLNEATGHVTTSSVVVMDWDDYKEPVQSLYRHAQPATVKVDERAEFEAWHNIRYPLHSMLLGFCERTGGYSYPSRREMFEVWQARAKLNGVQS